MISGLKFAAAGALVALGVALPLGGYFYGRHEAAEAAEIALLQAAQAARRVEHAMQEKIDANRLQAETDKALIRAKYGRELDGLRNRPERLPPPARQACQGASGAELSRPDASFLAGETARADRLRAELAKCQSDIDAIYDAYEGEK